LSAAVPTVIIAGMSGIHHLTNGPLRFARVALPVPVPTLFTYEIPAEIAQDVFVGRRVEVPFGRSMMSGVVVELLARSDVERTRPIRNVLETFLPPHLLGLSEWMASYYGCSVGEAIQATLPPSLRRARKKGKLNGTIRLNDVEGGVDALRDKLKNARKQLSLVERLFESGGEAGIDSITRDWGFARAQVEALVGKGIAARAVRRVVSPLESIESPVTQLTADQTQALEKIAGSLAAGRFEAILLHGVTGSGKTEIYLRAAQIVLARGGGCIVLVPEISLLPQAVARYRRMFGDEIAVIHSRLSGAERFDIWERAAGGKCRLVLGPRSAVFSPVENLRLIIVDEEQDDSYKQEDKPRYHARNVALMRGKREKLVVVLGSATPSAESLHHAFEGRYTYLTLPSRVSGAPLPAVRFVDLRKEPLEAAFFSSFLLERLEQNLRRGHQTILFLNKRGHARFVQCNACGWTARCRNCDIALIYHRVSDRLKCHYCGFSRAAAARCDQCGGSKLFFAGAGTQRVELDLAALLPGVGILRMDADTTTGKEGHRRVLEEFSSGKYPILVGTQMVAKGHHFPGVNLVGVLYAEESLNYPDFRSAERTFQQLLQVAGRAGRAGRESEVVIQTFVPDHYVFNYLRSYDYSGFMKEELTVRRRLRYPPYSRIVLASFSAPAKDVLHRVAQEWADAVTRKSAAWGIEVLGPAVPSVERVKNRYREHVLIKGGFSTESKREMLDVHRRIAGATRGGQAVELRWDVDPESFA
jgi:primosomal protein N' (replication factor Y)